MAGKIVAVCISRNKGERKRDVNGGLLLRGLGLEGDAHAGSAHRQVSLLSLESIQRMRAKGFEVEPGSYAENLTVAGIDLVSLPIGTRLFLERGPILRVSQIGKQCHNKCAVYHQTGECVMPKEGIFAEVLTAGEVHTEDGIRAAPPYRIGVITASDKGARGERQDESGPLAQEMLLPFGDIIDSRIMPDERLALAQAMRSMADEGRLDLLITTGGTGLSPRDVTPEATMDVVDRLTPGIPEAMRAASSTRTPRAMLSRGVAGIRGRMLIVNLPGSPRGMRENLEVLVPALEHALEIVTGRGGECGV